MSYIAHTETLGTLKLEIFAEDDIEENPREEQDDECLFGTMATWHKNYPFR